MAWHYTPETRLQPGESAGAVFKPTALRSTGGDTVEKQLAALPTIGVAAITLEGDANGAPHPETAAYAKRFTGPYEHRNIGGGVGHNLPQEAPRAFAQAVIDAGKLV